MSTSHPTRQPALAPPISVFDRILVAVDGSPPSFDACRQVRRLAPPHATVEAAIVSLFPPSTAAALGAADLAVSLERTASSALSAARAILGPRATLRQLEGLPVDALLREVQQLEATLLAIGAPERPRFEEIVVGGVGGELVHRAPCSVLVARPVPDTAAFPREIVVGLDGSAAAEHAYRIAREVAASQHSSLRSIVATGGRRVDLDALRASHPELEAVDRAAVPALVEVSTTADLLVVGSRGLRGPRALGSVSERVAHEAACSVLVVR